MPKRAKKAWRKNINLDDYYEGLQRTREELARGGIVREKPDTELFSIDAVGAAPHEIENQESLEPSKKRRKPLYVDQVLATKTETHQPIQSYVPKNKRPKPKPTEKPASEENEEYDVWNKVDVLPAPEDLPPPATLPYAKSLPAQIPSTMRTTKRLLRSRDKAQNVVVAEAGQSYNPALEDWEELINGTAEQEQQRLLKKAEKERVAQPDDLATPVDEMSDSEEEESEKSESFLRKPVKTIRKTRAQRNRQAREMERVHTILRDAQSNCQERLRKLAQTMKSKQSQLSKLPELLSQVSLPQQKARRQKKSKELPTAPLEVQLSDELAESLRLLKPEGNLFRDRYRSMVERGIVEGRFAPNTRGRKYPVKYVEKYDYKHWGKYYQK